MIRFSTGILDHQDLDLDGEEKPEILELENDPMLHAEQPIRYRLHVKKVSSGALVTGVAATVVTGECGRCLEPAAAEVSTGELKLFYELDGVEEIDVTEDVRSELLLNLPANLLCNPECAGLCPVCGGNRNKVHCNCEASGGDEGDEGGPDDGKPSPWTALDHLALHK